MVKRELLHEDSALEVLEKRMSRRFQVQVLAATPLDSRERFEARALLPGMAARLREVSLLFQFVLFRL